VASRVEVKALLSSGARVEKSWTPTRKYDIKCPLPLPSPLSPLPHAHALHLVADVQRVARAIGLPRVDRHVAHHGAVHAAHAPQAALNAGFGLASLHSSLTLFLATHIQLMAPGTVHVTNLTPAGVSATLVGRVVADTS
jgi:hypothetical protein